MSRPGRQDHTAHTDTYHGRFATLVPNQQVEVSEFETVDSALRRDEIATAIVDADGGTKRSLVTSSTERQVPRQVVSPA
jgi:hypothetical protein